MNKGAHYLHEALRGELINYLRSQYFGKSEVLLDACERILKKPGTLFVEPYIESSPAYETIEHGIENSRLPAEIKRFFERLMEAGLGVYRAPFRHQLEALEYAWQGMDLFVSTGTGSGKTECFMWPLAAKLVSEASACASSWEKRGIRAIVMYPMNALVSDQVGRLRRLIGDPSGEFIHIFRESAGRHARRPQFGMYTGRTPYPGKDPNPQQDRQLAKSLHRILAQGTDTPYYQQLLKNGKVPAKQDFPAFIKKISLSDHSPGTEDAELVTRFEMQEMCPDILITNYSMLEYILLRPIEKRIWEDTKKWLDENPDEKLLFIIDEAHMYRGSAGGEVALLLRRLLYKLGVSRDRFQFILTSASMPNDTEEDRAEVLKFARDLTGATTDSFIPLNGQRYELSSQKAHTIPMHQFLELDLFALDQGEDSRLNELNRFCGQLPGKPPKSFENLSDAGQWLYDHLLDYEQFIRLFSMCRGKAIAISELAKTIFPDDDAENAVSAIDGILSIAPIGKDASGSVLFPARMHMIFRGFRGVYACSNPECSHRHCKGGISLGEVILSDARLSCPTCGSRVYELYNDRRCGALFFQGYVEDHFGRQYLWTHPGAFFDKRKMKEIHLYIPMDGEKLPTRKKGNKYPVQQCFLDYQSGYITFDDSTAGQKEYRALWYSIKPQKGNPDTLTFGTCPKCRQQFSNARITNFSARGNQSFFNLIKEQFQLQPPASTLTNQNNRFPNQGRKVLLFSDSRQKAAVLARDMALASDEMAVRQLFMIGLRQMADYEKTHGAELSLNDAYGYFLQEAATQHVDLFHGESNKIYKEAQREIIESAQSLIRRGRMPSPPHSYKFDAAPHDMQEHLLRLFCGRYNTLSDAGLCYLEPMSETMYQAIDRLEQKGVYISEEEFIHVFSSIVHIFLSDKVALGHFISDERRKNVRRAYDPFGESRFTELPSVIADILDIASDKEKQIAWMEAFKLFCNASQEDQTRYFLNLTKLHPVYDLGHVWHRCVRCAAVSPFSLRERCPVCGDNDIYKITDFTPEAFWRDGIIDAINGKEIRVIDTQEHTAQLSHKDQRDRLWSITEQYEMRFQDMIEEDEKPVDILSSTTTMEVGIDIGSLVAVGLRNMPPMRENYQQRAGRAGRRGASLSTIVTFAEGGPHDTYYFKNPAPMFQGDPRKPWIDIHSEKLLQRHLSLIILNAFMNKIDQSLDVLPTVLFYTDYFNAFRTYIAEFNLEAEMLDTIIPDQCTKLLHSYKYELLQKLSTLDDKVKLHPELFGEGALPRQQKPLLDALYEEGVIPTYSFPKDVVSTYIEDAKGEIEYQVDRGLDMAISEYAPGRSIVVDKKTYQIGGLYTHIPRRSGVNPFSPAKAFMEDPNYVKRIFQCVDCHWFGFEDDQKNGKCPFCGSMNIEEMPPMVRPWGFSPLNGTALPAASLEEKYSSTDNPIYSSQPSGNMERLDGCDYIRTAKRSNQKIIILNRGQEIGNEPEGFMICTKCGAAMPGKEASVLNLVGRPGRQVGSSCKHTPIHTNLGYTIITDMFVIEIELPMNKIESQTDDSQLWLRRSATTIAEALRLTASRILDVEFRDMQSGYRRRIHEESVYIDVFIYDSVSSGAGYSSSLADISKELLNKTEAFLGECSCERACHNCLEHYGNQRLKNNLDRVAALELLQWGVNGQIPQWTDPKVGYELFYKLRRILAEEEIYVSIDTAGGAILTRGKTIKHGIVYPAMMHIDSVSMKNDCIYVTREALTDAKPFALSTIREKMRG